MANPRSFAHVTPREDADPGRLVAFYQPGDRRLSEIPADELVELDEEHFRTWLLKQGSRWDFEHRKLAVRETPLRRVTAAEEILGRLDRDPVLLALVRALAMRLGTTVDGMRDAIANEADDVLAEIQESRRR